MDKLVLFAVFASPVWVVALVAMVQAHRRGARLDLTGLTRRRSNVAKDETPRKAA